MNEITWATPLYKFLRLCNASKLEKTVLDCGAGGKQPPLSLFYQYGYNTYGIEIAEQALTESATFCQENMMPLQIFRGDMRAIPFEIGYFSFVYSFNAIMFMTKPDIEVAMSEIERVLKPGGLVYVNFESVDDPDDSVFCETAPAKDLLKSTRFAKHDDNEADPYFENFVILRKEKRWIEKLYNEKIIEQVNIEYIAEKK